MESKPKRRSAGNSLPNTIVIQLVSPHPQAMPISVNTIPLLPRSKAPVEQQQRRPAPLSPNSTSVRCVCPPSKSRPEIRSPPRRRNPPVQLLSSAPRNNQSNTNNTNPPPGQERTLFYRMEGVLHPVDERAPIYNPPPRPIGCSSNGRAEQMAADCPCCCYRSRNARRWIPEPEQMSPRPNYNNPQSRRNSTKPKDRRDQATNTHDEPQDMQSLKMICETMGRAMVAAVTAVAEAAALKSQSPADQLQVEANILEQVMAQLQSEPSKDVEAAAQKSQSPADQSQVEANILAQAMAQLQMEASEEWHQDRTSKQKTSFSESIPPSPDNDQRKFSYPKSPRFTMASDVLKRDSPAYSPGVPLRSRKITGQGQRPKPNCAAGRKPSSAPTAIKGVGGSPIRRRLPTEDLPPVVEEESPGPTSPSPEFLVMELSEDSTTVASPTDLGVASSRSNFKFFTE